MENAQSLTVTGSEMSLTEGLCPVCAEDFSDDRETYVCPNCSTTHHRDCWDYAKGCAIYGCRKSTSLKRADETGIVVADKALTEAILRHMLFKAEDYESANKWMRIGALNLLISLAAVLFVPWEAIIVHEHLVFTFIALAFSTAALVTLVKGIDIMYLWKHIENIDAFLYANRQSRTGNLPALPSNSLEYYDKLQRSDLNERLQKTLFGAVLLATNYLLLELALVESLLLLPLLSVLVLLRVYFKKPSQSEELINQDRINKLENLLNKLDLP